MRAIGYTTSLPVNDQKSLEEFNLPKPTAQGRDLLVEIRAVAVNPVDTKVRMRRQSENGEPIVLGYDAAGVVAEVGSDVNDFSPGDEVYYAGDVTRPGTNSEFHLVDERIVGRKPKSLSYAEAAALPLTTITAWEALFDRLKVQDKVGNGAGSLLIVGGAGGVGSIAIQLARQLTDLTVIATASRPESQSWVKELGAHHVFDHSRKIAPQFEEAGLNPPGLVFSTTHTEHHLQDLAETIAPQGRFLLIDDPQDFSIMPFKQKAVSIHWEFMFTRSMFQTADMDAQGRLLTEVADLVDQGRIGTTLSDVVSPISAETLRRAHQQVESQKTVGKIVLEDF